MKYFTNIHHKIRTLTVFIMLVCFSYTLLCHSELSALDKVKPVSDNKKIAKTIKKLKKQYRQSSYSKKKLWRTLMKLSSQKSNLDIEQNSLVALYTSRMLADDNYPVMASYYAVDSLKLTSRPMTKVYKPLWKILRATTKKRDIHKLMDNLAVAIIKKKITKNPPYFKSDWSYFLGVAVAAKNKHKLAANMYKNLNLSSRYYMPGKYQQAMSYVRENDLSSAILVLKNILRKSATNASPLSARKKRIIKDFSNLALARIYYEKGNFQLSYKYYRKVTRKSSLFYESLFEQSWALFMMGQANHALGALYGATSPFFPETSNPEIDILRSSTYFFLCDYANSKNALADFLEKYAPGITALREAVEAKSFDAKKAYKLLENVLTGVSSESLSAPREVLLTIADQDALKIGREEFADFLVEASRFEKRGVYGVKKASKQVMNKIDEISKAIQNYLGKTYLVELKKLSEAYDKLYGQADFLFVELLLSEKDKLLGKELHASTKIRKLTSKKRIKGWGRGNQSWSDKKREFWWDEIGSHIYNEKTKCKPSKEDS